MYVAQVQHEDTGRTSEVWLDSARYSKEEAFLAGRNYAEVMGRRWKFVGVTLDGKPVQEEA